MPRPTGTLPTPTNQHPHLPYIGNKHLPSDTRTNSNKWRTPYSREGRWTSYLISITLGTSIHLLTQETSSNKRPNSYSIEVRWTSYSIFLILGISIYLPTQEQVPINRLVPTGKRKIEQATHLPWHGVLKESNLSSREGDTSSPDTTCKRRISPLTQGLHAFPCSRSNDCTYW